MSLNDIDFDLKFEYSLFKTKSEIDLKNIVIDLVFLSFFNAKQKNISVGAKSNKSEYQNTVEKINVSLIKDINEAIELAHLLSYIKPPVSQLHTTIIPTTDSSLYVVTSCIDTTSSSSTDHFIPRFPL